MTIKDGLSFLVAIITANAIFSTSRYLSESLRMWWTKYIGCCLFFFSTNKTAATVLGEAEMYDCSVSPSSGLVMMGKLFKCSLIAAKALLCSSPYLNLLCPVSNAKKGKALFVDFEMNRVRAVILPVSLSVFKYPYTLWFRYIYNRANLIDICINSSYAYHKTQKLPGTYSQDSFLWVEFHLIFSQIT